MVGETQKLTYSVAEAAVHLGIGKHAVRTAIRSGKLPMINFGRCKWRIPVAALELYLANVGAKKQENSDSC